MKLKQFLAFLIILVSSTQVFGQLCTNVLGISLNGTFSVNGIEVTTSSTGYVENTNYTYFICAGANGYIPYPARVGNNPQNSSDADNAPWRIVLKFSKPTNNITIAIGAAGQFHDEKFRFFSNSGNITVIDNGSCFTTVSSNTIISGKNSTGSGGGGLFTLSSSISYTELVLEGDGGSGGSVLGICSSSIVCDGGPAPKVISSLDNICPATSVNLNRAHLGTIPAGTSLVWFNNNTHTGTPLSETQITQASAGTYYAFYYNETNDCWSPASEAVVILINRIDSDGDGIPDACDLDDDNDGILDVNEGVCNQKAIYTLDAIATAAGATINPLGGSFNLIYKLKEGTTPVASLGNQFTIPFSYSKMSYGTNVWEGINDLGPDALSIRPNTNS